MPRDLGFIHRFVPPPAGAAQGHGAPPLLLLHGTGGSESDLLGLGREISPRSALLSPRGKVLENGMPRFFRRLAEGVFDLEDLVLRTRELAGFIHAAREEHGLDRPVALGYSNGANIAGSLLILEPGTLAGAVLFRPMVPIEPPAPPDLAGLPVLIAAGRRDVIVPVRESERLASLLRGWGADVSEHWSPGGHALGEDDIEAAREWLARAVAPPPDPPSSP